MTPVGLNLLVCEREIVNPKLMGSLGSFSDVLGPTVLAVLAYSKCLINVHPLSLLFPYQKRGGIKGLWKEIWGFSAMFFMWTVY